MEQNTITFRFSEYLLTYQLSATLEFSSFKVQLHTLNHIWNKPGGMTF